MKKFILTYDSFKEKSVEIEKYLQRLKLKEHEIMSGLLLLEEVFMRLRNGDENFYCNVETRKLFGNVRLLVSAEGEPFNPLEALDSWNEHEEDYYRTLILASRKRQLAYTRRRSENVVTINLGTEENQFRQTLSAMILGIIAGAVLKEFAPDYVVSFVDKNIITSIRTMFLNALNMMVAPVVFFSIIAGITSMADASDISRIGGKLILIYMFTTVIAAVFGMSLSSAVFSSGIPVIGQPAETGSAVNISVVDMIVGIIPKDLITPIMKRDMLQIIFAAVLFGTTINVMREKALPLLKSTDIINTLNLRVITAIAKFIPLVGFVSMTSLMLKLGTESLYLLGKVVFVQITGGIIMIGVYTLLVMFFGRLSPLPFLRKLSRFMLTPASMGSSTATMPFTMKFCSEKIGVSPGLASFSIPLGATINMDGSCIYFPIFTVMAAKMYGVNTDMDFFISLFIAIIAFSIGAPGVPGGAFICLTTIIQSLGMPAEAAAFALGVESLVSLFRMTINVIGDIAVTTAIASRENLIDAKIYAG